MDYLNSAAFLVNRDQTWQSPFRAGLESKSIFSLLIQTNAPFRQPSFVTPGIIWRDQNGVEFSATEAPNPTPLSSRYGWRTFHVHLYR